MPIHEYACHECGREFEVLVRASTVPECPACHSNALEKKLSVFATASATPPLQAMCGSPCNTCGHPDGPGACSIQ